MRVDSWAVMMMVDDLLFVCEQEALVELQQLQQLVPKESLVYFLMAKVTILSQHLIT